MIGGSEVVDHLHVLCRKLQNRIRKVAPARVVHAVAGACEYHSALADRDARTAPNARATAGRLEKADLVLRRAEIHGIDAGLGTATALRSVGVQNTVGQVQAPILGKWR